MTTVLTTNEAVTVGDSAYPAGRVSAESIKEAAPVAPVGLLAVAALWRRLVLFVAGMVFILGAVELALSASVGGFNVPQGFTRRAPAPYVEFYSEPNYHGAGQEGEFIDTNDAGFRYGPLPVEKPPDELRVFFLASSFGFRGSTNDATIAGQMERLLASTAGAAGRRIRVVNASGTSLVLRQSLVLLVTRILAYQPDIIVVFHGPEVLYYPTVCERRPGFPFDFRIRERLHSKLAGKLPKEDPIITLVKRTRLFQHFHPDLGRNAQQTALARHNQVITIDAPDQYEPYIDVVAEDLHKIMRIASAFGCRTLVALPPWRSPALLPEAIPRLAERVERVCRDHSAKDVHYADTIPLTEELTRRQLWRPDGIHWGEAGNRLIAERLVQALRDGGFLEHGRSADGTALQSEEFQFGRPQVLPPLPKGDRGECIRAAKDFPQPLLSEEEAKKCDHFPGKERDS